MTKFFNNPIVHGILGVVAFGVGWFLSSGNPALTLTIGGVLEAFHMWLVRIDEA